MIKGLLSILPLLLAPVRQKTPYYGDLIVEDGTLVRVDLSETTTELRIYESAGVTTIAESAFNGHTFSTFMISKTVQTVNETFPSGSIIYFTGARSEMNFAVPENVTVVEYGYDEGFMNYWTTYIRPNIDGTICNVKKDDYFTMRKLFNSLNETDKETVNNTKDGTGTIKDSIQFLDSHFSNLPSSNVTEQEIPKSVMITFILIVASFGMTSIGIFYILKDKRLIG